MRTILAVLFSFFITTAAFAADNFVWIEAENPTAKHGIKELTTWGHEYISGHWVNLSIDANKLDEIDGEAILLQYEFEGEPGTYELWNRVGLEYVRSPFDWRIDGGEWTTAQPDDLTIDLMEIGFWCEIAWLKLGDVTLTGGKHTLEIRLQKRTDAEGRPQRILYASDCICLYPGKFEPYSKYKPNEDHRTAKDMAAAEYVFDARTRFKPPGTQFSLAGTWEICRDDELLPEPVKQPISRLPNTTRWSAIEVPGDKNTLRPDLLFAHRVWYRTKVILPEGIAAGYIEFPQNNLNTTVYVNGVLCGFDKNPFARVRIDVSKGLKPGENEIMVGIRDAWYARTEMADDPMKLRRTFNYPKSFFENGFQDLVYPIWHHAQSGILVEPTLHLFGAPIYANDIFVKPSVANKEISVDVTLRNVSDADQTVKLFGQCWEPQLPGMPAVGKKFELKTVTIKANSEMVVTFNEKWENPKLWTPNEPNLYNFGCIVKGDFICGTGAGVKFGFREWSISGKHFMLNGVPYRAWADCFEQPTKEEWLQFYRDSNQTSMRFWGIKWQGMPPEEALNFWDENGVVVRRSGTFDGQRIGYNAIENDPRIREMNKAIDPAKEQIKLDLFANWRDQMVAQVKGERNHPSIMLWSLENEILYINCINLYGGLMDQFEDEIIRGAQMVKEVDPTRSSMVDGGGATKRGNPDGAIDPWLPGGLDGLEVHGDHYVVGDFTKYPCLAYEPNIHGGGRGRWIWDENRPRHIGEEFYVNGYLPADFAAIGGEEAFGGRTAARRSVGILLRMMTEGYRWNEYGGWQFWTNQHRAIDQYKSNAPIAVFCKEWDWTFAADVTVERTLRIFNDSMNGEHISFMVECESAGGMPRGAATGSPKEFFVPAGRHEEFTLAFSTSAFQPANRNDARTEGKLTFVLSVKDREVFRDTKDVSVLRVNHRSVAARSAPTQTPNGYTLLIYDPHQSLDGFWTRHGFRYTKIDSLENLPQVEGRTILLIGKDALTPENCDSTVLQLFAAQGNSVIVLEQKHPLRYSALPCEMEPARNEGRIGFIENESHPIFTFPGYPPHQQNEYSRLQQKDFFTWTDGHILYRDAYKKPARGAKSLLQCDNRLENSAVVEVPVGQGVMILSQLLIGEKLAKSVVAQQLLGNMIGYAADYKLEYTPVIVCTAGLDENLLKELDAMQLKYIMQDSPVSALTFRGGLTDEQRARLGRNAIDFELEYLHKTVIMAATPENLKAINAAPRGYYPDRTTILLHGLTPEGLTEYNKLVGVDHMIREFRRERVGFPVRRSPLTQGLTLSDVAMSSGQRMFGWASDEFVASDTYTYVVDLEDVAPFATYRDDFQRMMSNGMVSADGWPYIVNLEVSPQPPFDFSLRFNRDIELSEVTWIGNTFYNPVTKFGLFFDGNAERAALFDVAPNTEPQTFAIEPTIAGRNLSLRLADWIVLPDKRGLSGLDNIELKQKRPDDFAQKVQPLLNIGAMVHYPRGDHGNHGGIVLCNLHFLEQETLPINAIKKRNILATILRNLGAEFVESQAIVAGTPMQYTPINMAEKCNGFRSNRGWLDNNFTFEAMPQGLQRFAGVMFDVYEFPTSPVPNCIIVRNEPVEGIAIDQQADALFFLHTMQLEGRRGNNERRDGKYFETLQYVVHYTDGSSEVIPIYAELDIEHFRQSEVTAIPGAMIGWVRKADGNNDHAVAYVKQWNNPHPDKTIATIDVVPGAEPRGRAAVLAITAAVRE